eukprot:GGOE01023151.1.p1 GENE.GGOE01023151.1~~GGOE01023151.1.p1  ORF type:complete len:732 (-),score=234.41 GGOE01023151.1:485-2356(-)
MEPETPSNFASNKSASSNASMRMSPHELAIAERDKARLQVNALLDFAQCLNELEIRTLCGNIMAKARSALAADRCTMFLVDEDKDQLVSYVADGGKTIRIPRTAGIAGATAFTASTINIPDAYADSRFNHNVDKQTGYKTDSLLCMPISTPAGKVIGVVQMINKQPKGKAFNEDDEKILSGLTIQAAVAIENSKMFEQTKAMQLHYETVLTSIPDIVMTLDGEGRLMSTNHEMNVVFGMSEADMKELKCSEWWCGSPFLENNGRMIQDIEQTLESRELRHREDFNLILSETSKPWVNYKVMPMMRSQNASMNAEEEEEKKRAGVVMVVENITAEKTMMDALGKYVSPDIAAHLLASGAPSLGGQRLKVSVLFVDIRDFTGLSEPMAPEDVVTMLNDYFTAIGKAIQEEKGTVDKYIGDCAMAVFGVPMTVEDDTFRSIKASLKIIKYIAEMNDVRAGRGYPPIGFGIGVNTGDVLAGNIGSDNRMEYTVIGDGVNLASRVESVTKIYGVQLMCTEFTHDEVSDMVWSRKVDVVRVVGKKLPVRLFEILGLAGDPRDGTKVKAVKMYETGLELYLQGRFGEARPFFAQSMAMGDRPAKTMHHRCEVMIATPPKEWDGVWTFASK